jgi:hypothetical protein
MSDFSFREFFVGAWKDLFLCLVFSVLSGLIMWTIKHFIFKNKIPNWMLKMRWLIGISLGIIFMAIGMYCKLNDMNVKMLAFFTCISYVTIFKDKQ